MLKQLCVRLATMVPLIQRNTCEPTIVMPDTLVVLKPMFNHAPFPLSPTHAITQMLCWGTLMPLTSIRIAWLSHPRKHQIFNDSIMSGAERLESAWERKGIIRQRELDQWVNAWMDEWMSEQMNVGMHACMLLMMHAWVSQWMNEWVTEWEMNGRKHG